VPLDQPHHDGSALYVPEGSPALGDTVPVFVRVPDADGAERVWLRQTSDAEPRVVEGKIDRTTETETWWRFDLLARNPLTNYRFLLDGGPGGYRWLNGSGTFRRDVTDAADFRVSTAPPPPEWAVDAIVYQIFPDRFARSAGADARRVPDWAAPAGWDDRVALGEGPGSVQLYGGDLDGIADHLDHIGSLGANTVYLTPFFPADSNHRYNASSFGEVDPALGGDKALVRLAREVHTRGWRLIGDLTANHCGDTHHWFRRALEDADSPERGFFYFAGRNDDAYQCWLGYETLPKFRHGSAELRRRLLEGRRSIAAKWLQEPFDLDGWRVDVANMTGRHRADDDNAEVARTLRSTLAEIRPEALLLAEHCHDASGDLAGDGWHGAMSYSGFTRPVWSWVRHPGVRQSYLGLPLDVPRLGAESLLATVRDFIAAAPWRSMAASWSLLGSHDSARIRTVVRDADLGEVAAGLLFTMPGAPMVFAGDEIGVEGAFGDARRPFPWLHPERWDQRTLRTYTELAALRRACHPLRRGGLRWVHGEGHTLAYLRESEHGRLLVLAVRAPDEPLRLPAAGLGLTGDTPNVHGGAPGLRPDADGFVSLPGDGPMFQVWQLA
jgi:alpha-glucosidase